MNIYEIKIGDEIDVQMGLELAKHFKLNYIVDRLEKHPEQYKPVIFDGCSGLPDELLGIFTGCKWENITYLCCLPHDIAYAYTVPGDHNDIERERVDLKFKSDLITKAGMRPWLAEIFYHAVRIGGAKEFKMGCSWGFGRQ